MVMLRLMSFFVFNPRIDSYIGAGGNDGSIWRLPIDLNLSLAMADPPELPFPSLLLEEPESSPPPPSNPSGFVSTAPPISLLVIPMKECRFFTYGHGKTNKTELFIPIPELVLHTTVKKAF